MIALRQASGFTMIEMVVTLTILSILTLAAMPLAEGVVRYTKERELRAALHDIRKALDQYKEAVDTGRIVTDTSSGFPSNLQALSVGVPDMRATGKMLYFLRRIPRDPFCPVGIADEQCWGLRSYASPPTAPMAGEDVFDVYSNSDLVGSDERPYRNW